MTNMAAATPTKCIDTYIPIEGTSKSVHLHILQGDITTGDTQAVVIFRAKTGAAQGDSLRILQAAGQQNIDAEYWYVQAQGGRDVSRGVVRTGAGNLVKPQHILHLHVDDNIGRFRDTLATAFRVADRLTLRSIAFPFLSNSTFDSFEETMLESIVQFTTVDRPICINFVQLVIFNSQTFTMYTEMRREMELVKAALQSERFAMLGQSRSRHQVEPSSCTIC